MSEASDGTLYYLSKDSPVVDKNMEDKYKYTEDKKNLIKNGSFEYWWEGLPMGDGWELRRGKISKAGDAAAGLYSLRLEPVGKEAAHLVWVLKKPLQSLKAGSRLKFSIAAKVRASDYFGTWWVSEINGRWTKITPPGVVTYTGNSDWETITSNFEIRNGTNNLTFSIWFQSAAGAPAFVDNFSLWFIE